ncbi:MAG: hypothetical protein H0X42_04970 [Solirubrobacterales bacterium]|nr:hypothetical protein [Solirubrobacterales bacterium]
MRQGAFFLVVLFILAAVPAQAVEVTRDSYRESVEPICKANTTANEKILGGVKAEVKANRLGPASVQFAKAAKALKVATAQLLTHTANQANNQALTFEFHYCRLEPSRFT